MSFLEKISSLIPFGKKNEVLEYFFALNIESENLEVALWTIDKGELKILNIASEKYKSTDEIIRVSDKLLDECLGNREIEVLKILFGVPDNWLHEENLKDEYLHLLRKLVKEFELTPMAYVASSHGLIHLLEKKDEVPQTVILVGVEENHITTTVSRAGKLDGTKILERGEDIGIDIEKALLQFTTVETLPSKIFLYGKDRKNLEKEKGKLLSFPWMSKLSFLHLPKIEILDDDISISSICLAGASELEEDVIFKQLPQKTPKVESILNPKSIDEEKFDEEIKEEEDKDNFGFKVGDVSKQMEEEKMKVSLGEKEEAEVEEKGIAQKTEGMDVMESNVVAPVENMLEKFEQKFKFPTPANVESLKKFIPSKSFKNLPLILTVIAGLLSLVGIYLFLPKASVKVFVEPRILERDAQVTADPKQKQVDESAKIIPAQIVETEISGSNRDTATGKKQVGDSAKGTVVIYNKTDASKSLSKGTTLTNSNGLKFSLDTSSSIASQSATDTGITFGSVHTQVSASAIGPDSNLPSGSEFTVSNFPTNQVSAKSEGNFSGGTSKDVTVVSSDDQQRLLAKLTSSLRQQAQQKLQDKLPQKKILEEALTEVILNKSFSKNISDQASDFSLNLTVRYRGTAFSDQDLRTIVAKLVTTEVPEGYQLNLSDTETQADVAKLEKDGTLKFLARFRAKLLPKINPNLIRDKIRGKTPKQAIESLKSIENVLGAEIIFSPNLPQVLQRLPFLNQNIKVDIGLK